MSSFKIKFQTVDEYFNTFPKDVQDTLEKIRETIKSAAPEAEEVISYQLPAFKYHGFLIYFSAYKDHYSLSFPPPFKIFEAFKNELSPYEVSKTSIKFPMDKLIPFDLVIELVKYKVKENLEKEKKKK
ncbi:iron chaperone [Paenibacillus piri]|uniref:DUF1801 domain-containing protein n=1 Tax=Paenibacillus piri TaxID=2547395 RepID=A0A4R5K831_9BACL|nr:DUF1801 domain-containing protein [Paenibacillus piri]TDF89170.1 DUF1801 domain-containing protein [Paenibacillus piri]